MGGDASQYLGVLFHMASAPSLPGTTGDLFEPVSDDTTLCCKVNVVLKDVVWHTDAMVGISIPGEQAIWVSGLIPPEAAGFPRVTILHATFPSCAP